MTCVAGPDYLKSVSDLVSKFKGKTFLLKKPAGATLKKADLDDTIYSKEDKNGWEKFYLPKVVSMQVVGVVEEILCPWDQPVLMTCEDGKIYAYDGEELHVVASSLKQLYDKGIEYPASKSYYRGEAFKDMVRGYTCLLGTSMSWMIDPLLALTTFIFFLILCVACRLRRTGIKSGRALWERSWIKSIVTLCKTLNPNSLVGTFI